MGECVHHRRQADKILSGLPDGDYARRFAGLYTQVARSEKAALVPFFLQGVADGPDPTRWFQPYRIHPNAEAQPLLLDNVWPELKKLLCI